MMNRYPERESKILEFKEILPSFATLIKTCVAFANTAGGQIIIGVADQTRKIVGVRDADREKIYESFHGSVYEATSQGLLVNIYERNFGAHSVMVIDVPLSASRPCFVKKEGMPKGVYLRVGASTRRAGPQHVEELMRESRHLYYDAEPTHIGLSSLSKRLLTLCYGSSYALKKLESDGVIVRSTVSPSDHVATVAGVLMFYENPEEIFPEATITCTEFAGVSGRRVVQTRELHGPISRLAEDAMHLLEYWLERHFELKGAALKGSLPIPKEALREAIANALIHRKYTVPGSVKIACYEDRVEIFSPGGFPGLVDVNHLGDGTTYLRNPHIAKLCRRLKLVEKLGTGIRLMFDACRAHGLKAPEFHEEGDFVKVIFSYALVGNQDDDETILEFIRLRGSVSSKDLMIQLNVSRNTAARRLKALVDKGLVQRTGRGPNVRYRCA